MSSIAKRPDGRWRARYRDEAGREHSRHFNRKVDARAWLNGVSSAIQTGTYVDPGLGKATLAEYAAIWIERQPQLAPSTLSHYRAILRVHVLPEFGNRPLTAIDYTSITAWVTRMSKTLAPATVRHNHRVLHMLLTSAMRDGRIARNLASGVKLPKPRQTEMRFLTHQQVADLAAAADDDGLMILVLAYCGLRFGELAALRVRHVDPLRSRLRIEESVTEVDGHLIFGPPKSNHRRTVPVPEFLVQSLVAHVAGKSRDDLVFTAQKGGPIWLRNWRPRVFDPAVRDAGVGPLTPHGLRHTAASLAVAAQANVKVIQRMLGHASAAMTLDTYSGLFDDDLDGVADRLNEAAKAVTSRTPADYLRTKRKMSALAPQPQAATAQ